MSEPDRKARLRLAVIKRLFFYFGVLLVLFGLLRWHARNMTYPAPSIEVPSPPPAPLTEVAFEGRTGVICAWSMEPDDPDGKPLMVFFHGNGENLATLFSSGFFHQIVSRDWGILAVDFPGYGRSEGRPGESALLDCGQAAVRYAADKHPGRPLLIAGWSLGAAVAIQVSAADPVPHQALLLISPWSRLRDVASVHFPNWLVKIVLTEDYDSLAVAPKVPVPTLVIHGMTDTIIPIAMGNRVAAALPQGDFFPVPLYGHNDIIDSPFLWSRLEQFAALHFSGPR